MHEVHVERPLAVFLPGGGSDAQLVDDAFRSAFEGAGYDVRTVEPDPLGIVASYRSALAAYRAQGPLVVGGISIGAATALTWAVANPTSVRGVVVALPAWTGAAPDAPAAQSARFTAQALRSNGLAPTIAHMQAGTPDWLAAHLTRSWTAQWPELPTAFDEVADFTAPTDAELAAVRLPVAIVAATDDPLHPHEVAKHWQALIPPSSLGEVSLTAIGTDMAVIGRAALAALSQVLPSD